jgi:NAD(P)-dependent dehydrogenase (short-subunit alcohol dehydrogenase family)
MLDTLMSDTLIITGAAGHLGQAVTQTMLDEGHTVEAVLGPADDPGFLKHERLHSQEVNLFDEEQARSYVKSMQKKYEHIAAGLLLVGGFAAGNLRQTDKAAVEDMFRLNFYTAYHMVSPLFQLFRAQGGGRFVLVGTRPALVPNQGKNLVAYSLSKGLIFQLAELINAEGKKENIVASVVMPSTLDTPVNRQAMPDAYPSDWVPPGQVAEAIRFLLSDTGAMLRQPILKIYNNA